MIIINATTNMFTNSRLIVMWMRLYMKFQPLMLNVHYDNNILQQHLRNLLSMRNKTITETRDLLNRIIKNTVDHTRNKKDF